MRSVFIYREKIANCKQDALGDQFKLFSYIVYAGMCNFQDSIDGEFPTYQEAYEVAELVNLDPVLSKKVLTAFEESRATKQILEALAPEENGNEKKKTVKRSRVKPTQ
jgi:hypothetical protein